MKISSEQLTAIGLAVAAVYLVKRLGSAHQAGTALLAPISGALGRAWSDLTAGPGVEGSFAYVILKPRDFDAGTLKPLARQAIETMHPGNAGLLAQVVNQAGQLKSEYMPLLLAGGLAITEDGVTQL